jgi:hypothetical protein
MLPATMYKYSQPLHQFQVNDPAYHARRQRHGPPAPSPRVTGRRAAGGCRFFPEQWHWHWPRRSARVQSTALGSSMRSSWQLDPRHVLLPLAGRLVQPAPRARHRPGAAKHSPAWEHLSPHRYVGIDLPPIRPNGLIGPWLAPWSGALNPLAVGGPRRTVPYKKGVGATG